MKVSAESCACFCALSNNVQEQEPFASWQGKGQLVLWKDIEQNDG